MFILIRYPVGVVVEGVVLASGRNKMRIAAAGFADTLELRRSGSNWIDSNREVVELDFLMFRASADQLTETAIPVRKTAQFAYAN